MTGRPLPALAGTAAALVLAAAAMLTGASPAPSHELDGHSRTTGAALTDAPEAGTHLTGALPPGTAP
ncbi:hypothetical protein FKN01_13615 [Streptomyces sp. 130]|uniref:hypothetical protein n=1 Tax=Streptomyces sp. 130 TaxID=2591006 RepID=UPI00117CEEBE|nr:hypothetical protein [Streptomyces sp. 130]TRV78334.1 hypothetical protein FKN01_13615 [Streptomyces sp. 130]